MAQPAGAKAVRPESPLPAVAGQKRKRLTEKKYYAVKVGKEPGVYDTWDQCLAQVTGQKGAQFKSFVSKEDAQAFVEGKLIPESSKTPGEQKFYAVQHGKVPGVYTDWPSAQAQISGFRNPRHKKFNTRAEAEAFVNEGKRKSAYDVGSGVSPDEEIRRLIVKKSAPGLVLNGDYVAKDKQGNTFDLARGPLPPGAEDGYDPNIKLDPDGTIRNRTEEEKARVKTVPREGDPPGMLKIYTDGSSLSNGQVGARAGVGVYFGPAPFENISEALKGSKQTNQRAELTAIQRALDIAPSHRDVTIFTDSRYAIDCVTNWFKNWMKNGWTNSRGKPVENKDIVQDIREKINERDRFGKQTLFVWVKGHGTDKGNIEADRLAVEGARKGLVEDEMSISGGNASVTADEDASEEAESDEEQSDTFDDPEMEAALQLRREALDADENMAENGSP